MRKLINTVKQCFDLLDELDRSSMDPIWQIYTIILVVWGQVGVLGLGYSLLFYDKLGVFIYDYIHPNLGWDSTYADHY
jgi:hypothetical protein